MTKIPPDDIQYPSRAPGEYVHDRRDSVRTPIPTKSRTTRSARRALRSYLTAVTFRQHFLATLKIIRLLNRWGFSFRWLRLVSRGCDGARVNPGVAKSCAEGEKGRSRLRYKNRGRNIHRLLIRRRKHRKLIRQIAQQRKKRKFKLGWISRLLQLATTNRGSCPEIQDDPGGKGGEGEARDDEKLNTTNKELCSMSIELPSR